MVKLEIIMKTLIYTVSQLDKNSIPYWIDFGTLLGACRNNELISNDDDSDICIDIKYKKIIENIFNHSENNNYYLLKSHKYKYQIIEKNYKRKRKTKYQTDIFFWKKKGDFYYNEYPMIKNNGGSPIDAKFINSLETMKIDNYSFKCPKYPDIFIEMPNRYGTFAIKNPTNQKGGTKIKRSSKIFFIARSIQELNIAKYIIPFFDCSFIINNNNYILEKYLKKTFPDKKVIEINFKLDNSKKIYKFLIRTKQLNSIIIHCDNFRKIDKCFNISLNHGTSSKIKNTNLSTNANINYKSNIIQLLYLENIMIITYYPEIKIKLHG